MFRTKIRGLLNNHNFEKFIISLVLLNILFLILSTVKEIKIITEDFFYYFDFGCTIIFTIEFILRLLVVQSFKQIFRFMMIIDFIAILPFYLGQVFGGSAIFLRIIRISKLLRLAKLARYSKAFTNIKDAFREKKEELVITLSFFFMCVIISGILMYLFEHSAQPNVFSSIPRSCYFAIVTFTTVGYGDFSPITEEGRCIAAVMAVLGACIHGILVGVISSAIMSAFRLNNK